MTIPKDYVIVIHPSLLQKITDEIGVFPSSHSLSLAYGHEVFSIPTAKKGYMECMSKNDMYIKYSAYFLNLEEDSDHE